jgi:hypothetical protein
VDWILLSSVCGSVAGCHEPGNELAFVFLKRVTIPLAHTQLLRFEVFTALTIKNAVFWDMTQRVALVRTDVSEERFASIIRVKRISEVGITLAVTSNSKMLRRNTDSWLLKGRPHGVRKLC